MLTAPQRLKLDLMTHGLEITPEADAQLRGPDAARPVTLADYASTSGVTLEIENDIWVNAPIKEYNPNFVDQPQSRLVFRNDEFFVCSDGLEIRARPIPVPSYYNGTATTGEQYITYGITHTDRVRISPIEGCSLGCSFCDVSFKYKYRRKSVKGLLETVQVALRDPVLPARHIMISGGTPYPEDFDYLNGVYEQVAKAFPTVPLDIMMVPIPGLLRFQSLKDLGVRGLSINLELFNESVAHKLMPRKSSLPRKAWLEAIDHAVKVFGQGVVRSLLLVGLESMDDTIQGVETLAAHGCVPVLSPFRPDPATPLCSHPPPTVEHLTETYKRSSAVASSYGMKLGPYCVSTQYIDISGQFGYYFSH